VYRYCIEDKFVMDKHHYEMCEIEGATVLEAYKAHYVFPVTVFDFEALYPSCIITYNLCPTVFIDPYRENYTEY